MNSLDRDAQQALHQARQQIAAVNPMKLPNLCL